MKSQGKLKATAVMYVRIGQAARRPDWQIEQQRQACLWVAELLGCEIVEEFVDVSSHGSQLDRTELQRMLRRLGNRPVEFVITQDLARLSRQCGDLEVLRRLFREAGAQLVTESTAADGDERTTEMLLNLAASFTLKMDHERSGEQHARARRQGGQHV